MEEFIGLVVLAVAIALITVGVPWFRRRDETPAIERFMLAEAYTIVVIGLLALGGALVLHDLATAWSAGETTHVIVGVAAIAVLIVAARFARGLFARRRAA
jgi:xanthine/uracil permease